MQNQKIKQKSNNGFTLIELILVVSIVVIIFSFIFVLLDPTRRVAETRNSERQTALHTLGDAIKTYQIDNIGGPALGIDSNLRMLGTAGTGCAITCSTYGATQDACLNLAPSLISNVASIPKDPVSGTDERTQYAIRSLGGAGLELVACQPELGKQIIYQR